MGLAVTVFFLCLPFFFGIWSILFMIEVSRKGRLDVPLAYQANSVVGIVVIVSNFLIIVFGVLLFLVSWKALLLGFVVALFTYRIVAPLVKGAWDKFFMAFEKWIQNRLS